MSKDTLQSSQKKKRAKIYGTGTNIYGTLYQRSREDSCAAVISCDVTSGENIFTAIGSGLTYHQFVLGALN